MTAATQSQTQSRSLRDRLVYLDGLSKTTPAANAEVRAYLDVLLAEAADWRARQTIELAIRHCERNAAKL